MSTAKHTPGPWIICELGVNTYTGGPQICISAPDTHGRICTITERRAPHSLTKTLAKANARLISASPSMLEALDRAENTIRKALILFPPNTKKYKTIAAELSFRLDEIVKARKQATE